MTDEYSWKPFLQRNRAELVKIVDFEHTELWDAVISYGCITAIQKQSIQASNNTNFRQVGAFLDHLQRKGKKDYDAFILALKKTGQDSVVEFINNGGIGDITIPSAPVPAYHGGMPGFVAPESFQRAGFQPMEVQYGSGTVAAGGSDALPTEMPEDVGQAPAPASPAKIMEIERIIANIQISDTLTKCTKDWLERTAKEKKHMYPVKNATRGRGLVITNTGDREGWEADVKNVAKMFKYLNFMAEFEFDLTFQQYKEKLDKFAQCPKNAHVDCVWVILMGHGGNKNGKDYIQSRDGKAVYINRTLEDAFNNKTCLVLQKKPKAFIVQICRGGKRDQGVSVTQTDATALDATPCMKLGTFTDYVYGYATQEGKAALRDIKTGTWYIQKLTEVLMEQAAHTPVTDMLTEVNRLVGREESEGGDVQTTEMRASLKGAWYLAPGL